MKDYGASTFLAHTILGVEPIAWEELARTLDAPKLLHMRQIRDQNGVVVFEYRGDPKQLLSLRSTEDVFVLVGYHGNVDPARTGLRALEQAIVRSRHLDAGLAIYQRVRGTLKKRVTFRVVARKQGNHDFRRIDAQRATEKALLQRYGSRWKLVEDDADVEIWVTLLGREAFFGLRLSTRTMRHRAYTFHHLPASLRPTVAFGMAWLSDPQPDDVVLDPMCGAGTILIERALAGRYRLLLGGDQSAQAVQTTLLNIGTKYKPIEIKQWDATDLPLADASVDKVVSNLPFGVQIGTSQNNKTLYPRFLAEMVRVVKPGGRLVLLTREHRLLSTLLKQHQQFSIKREFVISLLGMRSTIFVVNRL